MNRTFNIIGYGIICLVVLGFILAVTGRVWADDKPEAVGFALKAIKANQEYLSQYRPIVEEWERRKDNNAVQVGILKANGYDLEWSSLEVIPLR